MAQHWIKLTKADLDVAQQYFELALEKDPGYAPAHAGIALVSAGRSQMGIAPPPEAASKAKAAALEAVRLDDTLAEAHYALAVVWTWHDWDLSAAGPEWRRAVELNPSFPDARAFYSHFLYIVGRPEAAMPQIERALELDPYNALFRAIYAFDLLFSRRYGDAVAQAREVLRMQPDSALGLAVLWNTAMVRGNRTEALAAARTYYAMYGSDLVEALDRGAGEGGYTEAMRRAAMAAVSPVRSSPLAPIDVSDLYREAGDRDRALEWLEKACAARDPSMPYIGVMPIYDGLRSEARFQALLRRMGLPPS